MSAWWFALLVSQSNKNLREDVVGETSGSTMDPNSSNINFFYVAYQPH